MFEESSGIKVRLPPLNNIKIIIPMAGRGSRFAEAGYKFPKPLIDINGKPMIQRVVENIGIAGEYIFLVLKEHCDKYALNYLLPLICRDNPCTIIQVDQVTEGAACTALLARNEIVGFNDELIIANSDQLVEWSPYHFLAYMQSKNADGGILTFDASDPKWSYARLAKDSNAVVEVAEKNPISHHATVGIYYWKRGYKFVESAEQMIQKNIRVNNEFYICPTYNELIQSGHKILSYPAIEMHGLGTPEDLVRFLDGKQT